MIISKKYVIITTLLLLGLTGCSQPNSNDKTINNYMDLGDQSYQAGNFDEALKQYDEVIKLDSKYVDAYINEARCFVEKKDVIKAQELLDKAKELQTIKSSAYDEVAGMIYFQENQLEKAIESFSLAIKLDDRNATVYSNRGQGYFKLDKLAEAKVDLNKSISLDSKIFINYYILAQIAVDQKDFTKALEYANKGLEINNLDAKTTAIKGYSSLMNVADDLSEDAKQLEYDKAWEVLVKANQLDVNEPEVYNYMGLFKVKLGSYELAKEYYSKAIKLDENNAVFYNNYALVYYQQGNNTEARELIDKAILLDNKEPKYYLARGFILVSQGLENEAINDFNEAIKLDEKYQDKIPNWLVEKSGVNQ